MTYSSPISVRGHTSASLAVLVFCLSLTGFSSAHAEDQPDKTTTVTPVVVSATRLPTPVNQVASSITVITAREIDLKQERNLPDILRDVPGLNLVQSGGPGGTTSLFMRGTNSNHTKVLIDGIDVSDPTTPTGTFQFQNFLSAGVQQVEVLRGPQSGLYGSDAIGGVVNVVTAAGSGPAHGQITLEGGSFGTFNQTASVSGSLDRFSYALDLAHLRADDSPVTPTDLAQAAGVAAIPDAYDNQTIGAKLGYKVTDDFDLGLVARYIQTDLHFTSDFDFGSGPDPVQSKSLADQLFTRATAHLVLFDGLFDQTLGLGYTDYRRDDLVPNNPSSPNDGDRYKVDWQGVLKITPDETLVLGAEHQRDEIVHSPISAQMTNDAGFAELQSSLGGVLFNTLSVRYDANDRFGDATTYRIAPSFLITQTGTRLKASIGTGFKAPTLNELFVSFPAFGFFANPNLRPEHSFGYELGFEQDVSPFHVLFGATYFHNDIKDLIDDNASFTTEINVGRATTQGVEAFVTWRPITGLSLRGDYTYTDAEDDDLHEELLRRPKDKASLNVAWQATRQLSVTAEALYVGPRIDGNRDFTISRLTAPGYSTVNLTADYQINQTLTLFGRITNLLDRRYEDPVGFLQPRIGVFAGAKASF
jgi:vitamin B12 transporter